MGVLASIHASLQALQAPDGVHLWSLNLQSVDIADMQDVWPHLPAQDRARCMAYQRMPDRVRFACCRLALRALLHQYTGKAVLAHDIVQGPYGKPTMPASGWHFNISHSASHAVFALSASSPVGIDIECMDTAMPWQSVLPALTEAEQAYCQQQADGRAAFFRIWTGKEALFKAWGLGIAQEWRSISLIGHSQGYRLDGVVAHAPMQVQALTDVPSGYAAALAWAAP
ncbi:4'-phosphopantetheinyl transferase superfamily protein [Curvibacter sp. CHRR-16]|uniref:4'-phosphopantetheinyl transferase family protein n=1 Tax=Curvibacter sp. CHRR-16 TaxID=2835872 RepID=UPI001BDAABA9|nr:4'-phosphopantetheinyl transferase superfamily protein [Curvibacter sp. CHRR-16]MBT0570232.1 4'-phosphopantetheinyl transferase superfamily protein [Curvibacter sp. CHRR-16]